MYECYNNSYKYADYSRQATNSEYPAIFKGGTAVQAVYIIYSFINFNISRECSCICNISLTYIDS